MKNMVYFYLIIIDQDIKNRIMKNGIGLVKVKIIKELILLVPCVLFLNQECIGLKSVHIHENLNKNDYEKIEIIQITLMAENCQSNDKFNILMSESIGCVLLDSGCSKTVCGENWLLCFIEAMDEQDKKIYSI